MAKCRSRIWSKARAPPHPSRRTKNGKRRARRRSPCRRHASSRPCGRSSRGINLVDAELARSLEGLHGIGVGLAEYCRSWDPPPLNGRDSVRLYVGWTVILQVDLRYQDGERRRPAIYTEVDSDAHKVPEVSLLGADLVARKILFHVPIFIVEERAAAKACAGITHLDLAAGELEKIRLLDGCGCCCCAHFQTP